MNIHEHQAKQILKEFGAAVPEGVVGFTVEELLEKCKSLKTDKFVLKAQIHAGGRGKAGGVKLVKKEDIINVAKNLFGKVLVTPQTGPEGKAVKRIYVQKAYDIAKEFYERCKRLKKLSRSRFTKIEFCKHHIDRVSYKARYYVFENQDDKTDVNFLRYSAFRKGIGLGKSVLIQKNH